VPRALLLICFLSGISDCCEAYVRRRSSNSCLSLAVCMWILGDGGPMGLYRLMLGDSAGTCKKQRVATVLCVVCDVV